MYYISFLLLKFILFGYLIGDSSLLEIYYNLLLYFFHYYLCIKIEEKKIMHIIIS